MENNDFTPDFNPGRNTGLSPVRSFAPALMALSVPSPISPTSVTGTGAGQRMHYSAIVEATHEHYRALLTKSALENTAALSAYEAHLYRASPFGEERYSVINDVYAFSAAMRIARW